MAKWFKSYRYRFKFTIDNTKIDAALTDFPVALHIKAAAGTGDADLTKIFDVVGANWTNLAVCGADGETPLWTEVDLWDATGETGVLHVRVPKASDSADTDLYLYFDADGLGNGYIGATLSDAAKNVWDENFVAVWHLSQDPTGGAGCIKDSTSNGRTMSSAGSMTSGDLVDGKVGKSVEFDGSNDHYVTDATIAVMATLTAEMVHFNGGAGTARNYLSWYDNSSDCDNWILVGQQVTTGAAAISSWVGGYAELTASSAENQWLHTALTFNAANLLSLYVNGALGNSATKAGDICTAAQKVVIGGYSLFTSAAHKLSYSDEVRLSNIARSAAWLKATYNTLFDTLGAFSALEAISEAPEGSWLSDWQSRIKFTIASTLIDADLTDFPVALALSATAGTGDADLTAVFDALGANSHKIAVTDHTGIRQLFVEVDTWDSTAESAVLHTKVPHVDADTDTILYLYFDAAKADNDGYVGDIGDAAAQNVWTEYLDVWHLSQDPTGGAGCILDSTVSAKHGTPGGSMTTGDLVDANFGKGLDFDGSNDYVSVGFSGVASTRYCLEALFKRTALVDSNSSVLFSGGYGGDKDGIIAETDDYAGTTGRIVLSQGTLNAQWSAGAPVVGDMIVANSIWAYIALDATITTVDGGAHWIAANNNSTNWFKGIVGEVRLSTNSAVRTDAWQKATYNTLFDTLIAWSEAETFAGTGWLRGFTKRTKVTVAATNIDAALTHFPLTLFLSSSCGTGTQDMTAVFDEIGANYKKIAVTAADGKTQLPVEVDYWDSTGETAVLHVRVPSVDSEAVTALYLYYSADVPDNDEHVGDVTEAPAMSVWDSDFEMVLHMSQDPSATTMKDSTVNARHGTSVGTMLTEDLADGKVGKALAFDGSDDGLQFGDILDSILAGASAQCTLEAWAYLDAVGSGTADVIFGKYDSASNNRGMMFRVLYSTITRLSFHYEDKVVDDRRDISGDTDLSDSTWYYFVGQYDATQGTGSGGADRAMLFLNGVQESETVTDTSGNVVYIEDTAAYLGAGAFINTAGAGTGGYFGGMLDEMRISNGLRSAAWIKATYYSTADGLVTYTTDIESEDNWLGDWANRIQIKIDSSKIDANLTDFPVAIHLGAAVGINGVDVTAIFDELGANNLKLAVATAAGAQCYVEIDTWDETGETAVLHAKIPTVYAGRDTIFYLYYDSAKADNSSYVGVTGSTPGKAVWDANFLGVYHFSQDLSAGNLLDSTANGYDGTPANFEAGDTVAGQVGKHVTPDGSAETVTGFDAGIVVTGTDQRTTEILAYPDQSGIAFPVYLGGSGTRDAWALLYSPTEISAALSGCRRGITGTYGNTLRHVAISYPSGQTNSNQVALVVDGVAQSVGLTTGADGTINTATTYRRFFQLYTGDCAANVTDEVRISNVQRSTAWLKATYNTLFDTLLSHGAAEALGGGWLRGWKYRRAFTVPSTNIDADLSDFPLALILSTAAGTGDADISSIFDEIDENSKRIAVCAAHGDKQVPVEIDTWDGAGEAAVLHAKTPLITAADGAVLYVYYDDDRYDDGFIGETGEAIAKRVWDENFDLVNHFGDKDASKAGTNTCYDSSRQANHGTYTNTDAGDEITGQIGKGVSFDGTNEAVAGGAAPNITGDAPSTIEVIGKCGAMTTQTDNYFISFGENSATAYRKRAIRVNDTTAANNALRCEYNGAYGYGANNIDDNAWHHLVFAQPDGGDTYAGKAYVDGASAALTDGGTQTTVDTTIGDADDYYQLAREWDYSSSAWKYGAISLCEVRVSTVERSAAWLKATYNTLFDTLAAWGAEGEEPGDEPTTIEEPLSKAGRIDFTPHSLTDVLSMTEALSKAGRIDFTPHSLSESYTGNLLKMVDASGSRPKILTATGTKAKISAASGARPRLAAAEAYEYQERE